MNSQYFHNHLYLGPKHYINLTFLHRHKFVKREFGTLHLLQQEYEWSELEIVPDPEELLVLDSVEGNFHLRLEGMIINYTEHRWQLDHMG